MSILLFVLLGVYTKAGTLIGYALDNIHFGKFLKLYGE